MTAVKYCPRCDATAVRVSDGDGFYLACRFRCGWTDQGDEPAKGEEEEAVPDVASLSPEELDAEIAEHKLRPDLVWDAVKPAIEALRKEPTTMTPPTRRIGEFEVVCDGKEAKVFVHGYGDPFLLATFHDFGTDDSTGEPHAHYCATAYAERETEDERVITKLLHDAGIGKKRETT